MRTRASIWKSFVKACEARGLKLVFKNGKHLVKRAKLRRPNPPGMQAKAQTHTRFAMEKRKESLEFLRRNGIREDIDTVIAKLTSEACGITREPCVHMHVDKSCHENPSNTHKGILAAG